MQDRRVSDTGICVQVPTRRRWSTDKGTSKNPRVSFYGWITENTILGETVRGSVGPPSDPTHSGSLCLVVTVRSPVSKLL